jgi:hypothetical protein
MGDYMKMFTIMMTIWLGSGSIANANMVCKTKDKTGTHYELSYDSSKNQYQVWLYGHSRNNYKAVYKVTIDVTTRKSDHIVYLEKLADHSTWKDMPTKLMVIHEYETGNILLRNVNSPDVLFPASMCQ